MYIRTLSTLILIAAPGLATNFYVAPSGSSSGTGSISQPWSLAAALAQPAAVKPGDTIWLRGGTYRGNFSGNLNGSSTSPIIVRQYPGERATIDGAPGGTGNTALTINGSWTWYWGFEVMNSAGVRSTGTTGSGGLNGWGINVYGTNVKCINMVVHDNDQGFGFWSQADGSEVYGNVIYNNGWMAPDRGHGHGIYAQNQNNTKLIQDNVIFNQFSHGIHGYTSGGYLNNIYMAGNISFNNGYLEGGFERNILIGSDTSVVAQSPSLVSNYTYFTPARGSGENNLGLTQGCTNATVTNNYFAGGTALHLNCSSASVSGNTFYDTAGSTPSYPNNTYYSASNPPTGVKVFVRPNTYETGRGNIAVFNWSHSSSVGVDLSSILTPGASFEIRDAENFWGAPVVSGVYSGGVVQVSMSGLSVAQPIGSVPAAPVPTAPEFGAFIVLSTNSGSGTGTPDTIPPTVAIASPVAGQTVSGTVTLTATASDNVQVAGVQYKLDGTDLGGEQSSPPYSLSWSTTGASNGAHTLTAVARDSSGNLGTSAPVTITVANVTQPGTGTASASFQKIDTTTQGNWQGTYGSAGFSIPNVSTNLPSYASLTATNGSLFTWINSTSDVRALQDPLSSNHVASTWYAASPFSLDLNLTDGNAHQVALYAVDWDNNFRAEKIDVLDAASGALLDSRSIAGFTSGDYVIWNVSGHVVFRITKTQSGSNGVISGVFIGGGSGATGKPGSASASLISSDATTQGNWKGVYGKDGVVLAGDASNLPAYAQVSLQGQAAWTWVESTSDQRALFSAGSSNRLAATWYSLGSFAADINLTDGQAHQVALYCVDWDAYNRAQTIDVLDAATGTVLATNQVTGFSNGQYLVWNLKGHVTLRVTRTAGPNAVASALFFN
ncbi:MAG: hypothetical protein JWO80_6404 [Bryobacterales bacterium]|nr:hypothetical protein [Bryobacterales bacterium]